LAPLKPPLFVPWDKVDYRIWLNPIVMKESFWDVDILNSIFVKAIFFIDL